ncbi:MAG: hypothetical protein Q8K78_06400 [Planctomycetaceae bacterium]|nr:hypothetical protein [Planctomycetaceae bacterium]
MKRHAVTVGSAAVVLLELAGCGRVSPTPGSSTQKVEHSPSSHDHDHDHDHAPDRSVSFAGAVQQLVSRHDALLRSSADVPSAKVTRALQELKELARGLPELAGDSELRRADWEQVQRLAIDLQKLIEPWQTMEQVADATARRHYDKIIAELRLLAEKSAATYIGQ